MSYYIAVNGERLGPLTEEDFRNRVVAGQVNPDTLVWQPGMADWQRYADFTATQSSHAQNDFGDTGVCAECGGTFPKDDLIGIAGTSVCAGCKPILLQRVREGANLPNKMYYAGFWIRVLAKIIDGLIMGAVNMALQFAVVGVGVGTASNSDPTMGIVVGLLSWVVSMGTGLAYCVFFLGKYGATPGKMALGLKVIRSDGSRLTYMRALGRFFADMLSSLILCIGYIMVAFDSEKRALHDHICDTRVIKG